MTIYFVAGEVSADNHGAALMRSLRVLDPELKLEWFAVFDLGPVTPNLFADAAIDLTALILIIERDIRVFLKNSDLAHPLGADAAGSHVCHATVFKVKSRVCNVFALAEYGHADCVDTPERRADKIQNDFQIMNH